MVGKIYKGGSIKNTMEIKEILQDFEEERKFLLKELSDYKFTMTEILINQLHRIKAITKVIRELKSEDKELINNYKKERDELLSEIENEKIQISPTFLEQVHRLKIIKNILTMTGENKIINKNYIG